MKTIKKTTLVLICIALFAIMAVATAATMIISNSVSVTVNPLPTLTLVASQTTVTQDNPVTLTATCSDTSYTGTVTFYAGSTNIGMAPAVSGVAVFTTSALPVGTHSIHAEASYP